MAQLTVGQILTEARNPRGIPQLRFLDDITKFLADNKTAVEPTLESLQIMHQKFKSFEANLLANSKRYKTQIPDIESSLNVVKDLKQRQEAGGEAFTAHFNLADQLYAKAEITPQNKVALWLGANVMLEYTYDEAVELLTKNLTVAQQKAAENREDLDWVRDNIVVCEVNMARVFNYDVMQRRAAKKTGGDAAKA